MLEGYTTLGYVAGRTTTLRLRTLVTGVTYRHPGVLAKTVTTLDVLSGGRAELGIGAAWYEREHGGLGVPFPPLAQRFEMLDEAIQVCLQMWSDDDGPFDGRHYQLAETLCRPRPVSSPRPRIMIGGGGERKTLRLVAQYADACNFFGAPGGGRPQGRRARAATATRSDATRARSRSRSGFRDLPSEWSADDLVRGAEALAAVGVSTLVTGAVGPDPAGWLETTFGPALDRIHAIEPASL